MIHIDDAEGQSVLAARGPSDRVAVGVVIDEECGCELLEVSGEMDGGGGLSNAPLVGCDGHDHRGCC